MAEETRAQLEARLASASTEREKIAALDALGWELRLTDIQRSLDLCQQVYDLARGHVELVDANRDLLGRTLASLATAHMLGGGYDKALAEGLEAVRLTSEAGLTKDWYRAIRAVGFAYFQIADYPNALAIHLEGLKKAESLEDLEDQALFYLRIGSLYSHSGDYHQALEYYEKSLTLCRKIGIRRTEAMVYDSCAIEYRELKEFDKSREYALKALTLARELGQTQIGRAS